ncbi:neuronal acetylcholine receptor subunit beta-3-like [Haliotis rubra]|uniref:neuronal acetylcholine receptor subunit beta-3-like n=1 Tax=Haliotis rubra TaxID=36100 RepID=UPI001EE55213|nr:neuronal acetylcholine receptor subunit beta-3-like [Haliotis rubra]
MSNLYFVLAACISICGTSGRQSGTDQGPLYTLYNDLLEHYKPYIRPRKNPNDTVEVVVSYSIVSVEALDETTQTVASSAVIQFEWKDDLMTWNSSDYGGVQFINIPVEKLWFPDLSLTNGLEDLSLILPSGEIARVNDDGLIQWYHGMKKCTKCSLDMTKFPFDTQTCSINLIQWVTVISQVNLTAGGVHIESSMFQQNGEWEILDKSKEVIVHTYTEVYIQTELVFTFVFKRKYLYYIITNILPGMLLSVLNLGVFLLPPESGEKVSLCISIVLSYAVFLSVIGGSLPEVSDTVSIFSVYLLTMMFLKVATTLITVFVLQVYHQTTEEADSLSNRLMQRQIQDISKSDYEQESTLVKQQTPLKKTGKQLARYLNKIGFTIVFLLTVMITILCFALLLKE